MQYSHTLYNSLPSIEVANRLFTNRDHILSKLAPILHAHGDKFGVCLVHRHCLLEDGERMVTHGNISQPESGKDHYYHPERWLASGIPYEFTREETTAPPVDLLEAFQGIVEELDVLGLFYVQNVDLNVVALERTEGRKNIVTFVPHRTPRNSITTAWLPQGLEQGTDKSGFSVKCYECSACSVSNNSHVENVAKMEGLERNRDLGHEIGWLKITGDDVKSKRVHAV